jgi:hypothetical protein
MHSQNYKLTPAPSENCFAIFLLRVRSNNYSIDLFFEFPQQGTKRLMCHGKAQNVTIALHKKTYVPREGTKCNHSTAQKDFYRLVPLDGTKCATALHKMWHMCHSTAQNVPQHGTKCATGRQQKLDF